jgi:ligand-binding sensor domain-containing protein
MVDRNDRVWLGTYNQGVAILDRRSGSVQRLAHLSADPRSLGADGVFALLQDREGTIWIGMLGGLDTYSPASKRIRHVPLQGISSHDVRGRTITSLYEDSSGTIWIGSATSILRYDRVHDVATHLVHLASIDSLHPFALAQCFASRGGTLWCGTLGAGLLQLTSDGKLLRRYTSQPLNSNSLSHNSVKAICIDPGGILWIGTEDGLNRFDPVKESWTVYRTSDGMPNDFVYGVLMDNHRRLWLSTNKGIARFTPATQQFKNYDISDGLQSDEFNHGAYSESRSGELFFGGVNGFNAFFPDAILDNALVPPVYITEFRVFNKPLPLPNPIPFGQAIELSHAQNFFTFEFVALNYIAPEKNQYAYRLEGFDDTWNYVSARQRYHYAAVLDDVVVQRRRGNAAARHRRRDLPPQDHGARERKTPPAGTFAPIDRASGGRAAAHCARNARQSGAGSPFHQEPCPADAQQLRGERGRARARHTHFRDCLASVEERPFHLARPAAPGTGPARTFGNPALDSPEGA